MQLQALVAHRAKPVLNQDLDELAERLTFTNGPTTTDADDALYTEASVRGAQTIRPNHAGTHSRIDLELLFNAVVSPESSVVAHLNQPSHEPAL